MDVAVATDRDFFNITFRKTKFVQCMLIEPEAVVESGMQFYLVKQRITGQGDMCSQVCIELFAMETPRKAPHLAGSKFGMQK